MSQPWIVKRRCELVDSVLEAKPHLTLYEAIEVAFDAMIAEHEPAPVDPVLVAARQIVADENASHGCDMTAEAVRLGCRDYHTEMRIAIAALRRGIEIAGERK